VSDNPKLTPEQIEEGLRALPEWAAVGEAIQRTYQFKDFVTSMKFVNAVAQHAEAVQHHPDLLVRYSKVTVTLATHDAGGITRKDMDSAKAYDTFSAGLPCPAAVAEPVRAKGAGRKKKA